MTEEEIRPIAENYVEEFCHDPDGEYDDGSLVCAGIGTALIVSRQLEKRISDLEAQIEEIKECANCPVWLLNKTEKTCKDCEYKEALILLRK